MKLVHVLLVAAMAVGLYAKDAAPNPVAAKAKAMVAESKKVIKSITPKDLMALIKAEKDFVLIDVREPGEVAAGKIDALGYKDIPAGLVPFKTKAIKTDKKIVIYCKVGGRGALATKMMQDLGFTNVFNLEGGIKGWLKAGYPVENALGSLVIGK